MLRILGLPVKNVGFNLFLESLLFSFFGSALGIGLAYIIGIWAKYKLFRYSAEYTGYHLNLYATILGIFIGLLIPFAANILPIKRAIGTSLINALDLTKR